MYWTNVYRAHSHVFSLVLSFLKSKNAHFLIKKIESAMCCTQRKTTVKQTNRYHSWILVRWNFNNLADFHHNTLIINPSTKPTAICKVVNNLIGVLLPSWLPGYWYTKTFLDWACQYKEGHSQVIKVIGTNKVSVVICNRQVLLQGG